MGMDYKLTQHAIDVLQERNISIEWVKRVVSKPTMVKSDIVDDTLEHRLGEIVECDNRVLRVVVNARVQPIRIVTAYFDRAMKGKL